MKNWTITLILVFLVVSWIPQVEGEEKLTPGDLYDAGIELFHKEKYEEAVTTFSRIIFVFPKSNLVSYSQYMIGQCNLKMGKYEEAIQQFEFYLKAYPEGDRVKNSEQGIQSSKEKLKEKALVLERQEKRV